MHDIEIVKKKSKKAEKNTYYTIFASSSKRIYSLIMHSFQGFVHYFIASAETKTSSTNVIKKWTLHEQQHKLQEIRSRDAVLHKSEVLPWYEITFGGHLIVCCENSTIVALGGFWETAILRQCDVAVTVALTPTLPTHSLRLGIKHVWVTETKDSWTDRSIIPDNP